MKILLILSLLFNIALVSIFAYRRINKPAPLPDNRNIFQQTRTDIFKSLPKDSGCIVFVGNSITEGFPVGEIFRGKNIINRGVTGSETINTLQRVAEINEHHPSKVFLMEGINDIKNGVSFDTALARFKRIVTGLNNSGAKVYIQSVLPVLFRPELNRIITRFNDSISHLGTYIDLYPLFENNGVLDSQYTYDGLHLTAKGYSVWQAKIKESI